MGEHNELKNRYLHVDYKRVKDNAAVGKLKKAGTPKKESTKSLGKNVTVKHHSKMSQQIFPIPAFLSPIPAFFCFFTKKNAIVIF